MYVSTSHSGSPRPDGPSHVRAESSPSTSSSHGSPPGRFISGAQLHMTSSYAHAHGLHGTPNSGSVEHRGVFTHPHVADISPGPGCPSSPTADRLPTAAAMEEAARIVMSCAEWLLSQLYLLESEPRRQRQDAEDGGEDGSMCEAADGFARAAEDPAATDFPAPSSCTAPPMPELLYRFTMQPTDSDESATRTATTSSAIAEPAELSNVFETFFFPTELARYCRDATTTAASRPSPDRRSSDGTSHPHHTRRGEELTHSSGNTAAEPPVEMELRETFRAFLRYAQYCLHLALAPAHAEHLCEVAHPRQASPTHSSSSQPTMEEAAGRLAGGASHETWTTSSKIRCPPPHAMLRGSTMSSPCVPSVTSTPTISPTQAYLCNDETLPSGCYLGAASCAAAGANAPAPPPLRTTAKMIVQMLLSLAFSCPCEALASAAKLVLAEGLARLGCPSSGDYGLAAGLDCLANYSTEEEEDEDDGFMESSTEVAEQMVDGGAFAATRRLRLWFECDGSFQLLTSAQLRARRREDAQPRKDGHVSVLLRYQPPPSPLFPALQRFTMDGGVAADGELLRAAMEGASRGDGTCGVRSQPRSPLNRGGSLSYVRQGSMRQPPSGVAGISALQLRGEEAGTTSEDDRSARTSSSPAAAEKARALHLLLAVRRSHVLPSRAERRLTKTMTYNIFVELTECPNYLHLLGLSPRYLEAHYAALRYSLLGDGPLPVDMRLMIAVMVGARFPCEAVVTRSAALMCRFSEAAGLEDGEVEVHGEGEPVDGNGGSSRAVRWLLHGPPPKLVAAQSFIARATHNPWMVQPEEVRELLLHGWTVPELFQLITLIATIAPLCGLALGLSVPMEPCMRATLPPEMLAGMAAARGSSADLVDLPGPAQSNPRGWYSLYTGSDNITTTQRVHKRDGAERSTHTLWRGNFSWSDSGAYLMEQYYPGAAQRISEEMEVFTEEMQRLTEADCAGLSQPGVSPAFAMRSLYLYVQNLLGFQVEDYSYNEINRVLQRSPKLLAHMMTMRPQDFGAAVQSSLSGMRSFPQSASQITLGCPASPRGVDDGCSSPLSADSSNGVRRQLLREANGREERERSLLQTLGIANGSAMAMAMAGSSPALTDHTDLEEEEDVAKHAAAWRAVAEATLDLQQERMILLVALSTMVARKEGLLHILLYALCELVNNM